MRGLTSSGRIGERAFCRLMTKARIFHPERDALSLQTPCQYSESEKLNEISGYRAINHVLREACRARSARRPAINARPFRVFEGWPAPCAVSPER